jgi:hypothetical protein
MKGTRRAAVPKIGTATASNRLTLLQGTVISARMPHLVRFRRRAQQYYFTKCRQVSVLSKVEA